MVQPDQGPEHESPNQREVPIMRLGGAAGGWPAYGWRQGQRAEVHFGPSYCVCFVQKRNVLMLMLIGGG